ncbi:ABC transporter ATP-binding protein [Phytohabitans rumicis]|uniref:ABC transporter ATP-binding protein n=1 Tax=Phytohabitans rumicis TaxID=1076125 RepID=UPI0031EB3D48
MSLLDVSDLSVSFATPDGTVQAVRGVSFGLEAGRTLGIVGESGSGKSVAALSLLGLARGATVGGRALFADRDLLSMPEPELRGIRGARIAMVFQDPLSSLHPLYTVGWQIEEAIRAHAPVRRAEAHRRAIDLLGTVGIPNARERVDDYPHKFSGGMRQRVMIAMALALDPTIVIADEPTTALDATVQAQILDLLMRLRRELGMALIIITHDLGVVAQLADEVLVMYAGRVVEVADRHTLYYRAHHPYTLGLLGSVPSTVGGGRLRPIPGQPPSPIRLPRGCPFHPRCEYVLDRCRVDEPGLLPVAGGAGHRSACWLPATRAQRSVAA